MAVEVYHEPLCRRYYASRCSCAYFFFLLVALVGLILPFFLAYTNVPSFWLKTHTYREQPSITFQHKVCLLYTSPSPRDYAASRMPSSA